VRLSLWQVYINAWCQRFEIAALFKIANFVLVLINACSLQLADANTGGLVTGGRASNALERAINEAYADIHGSIAGVTINRGTESNSGALSLASTRAYV